MSQTDPPKRLPITQRVKPAKETPLTDRARHIIRAVGTYRRLTSWQIERLFFTPGPRGELNSQCKRWLRRLFHEEYLFRAYQRSFPDVRLPLVYCLDTPRQTLLYEVLALTKMNWNSAQFGGLVPITLRFSRLVGDIMREIPPDRDPLPQFKYYT